MLRFDIFLKGSMPLRFVLSDIGTVSDIGTQCQSKFTAGCGGSPASQLTKSIWDVIYLIYVLLAMGQYPSILIFVLAKLDKK